MNTNTPAVRAQVREALLAGASTKEIIAKYRVSSNTITSVRKELAVKPVLYDFANDGKGVMKMLEEITLDMKNLYDACLKYLADPNDPKKFDPTPRASETEVVCRRKNAKGEDVTTKQSLQSIIDELEETGYYIRNVKINTMDMRKVVTDLANTITKQLEAIARIQGQVKDVSISIINTSIWAEVQGIILNAVEDHPRMKKLLAKKLGELGNR